MFILTCALGYVRQIDRSRTYLGSCTRVKISDGVSGGVNSSARTPLYTIWWLWVMVISIIEILYHIYKRRQPHC